MRFMAYILIFLSFALSNCGGAVYDARTNVAIANAKESEAQTISGAGNNAEPSIENNSEANQISTLSTIPLCAGLKIVTAISQPDGDYESIKTIESVSGDVVRLKYSSERMKIDWLSNGEAEFQRLTMFRSVKTADSKSAKLYLQQFYEKLPESVPETTAIGVSTDVLNQLKIKGEVEFGIFIAYSQDEISLSRDEHPNVYDNQMIAKIKRVGNASVLLPVIVNDTKVLLPAIQATGDFYGDKAEFFFLDDAANPIALKYRIGIGAFEPVDAEMAKNSGGKERPRGDKDTLQVVKISYRCGDAPPKSAPAAAPNNLEQTLAKTGRAEVQDIFFSFNSAEIRDESESTLKAIADILKQHADWKLSIEGHTDNVANDKYNLELSQKRAAAVKDAIVKRYSIDAKWLTTAGFGEARPRDTNETLEGRARNRRVELVKQN